MSWRWIRNNILQLLFMIQKKRKQSSVNYCRLQLEWAVCDCLAGEQQSLWIMLALSFCILSIDLHLRVHLSEMFCLGVRVPVGMAGHGSSLNWKFRWLSVSSWERSLVKSSSHTGLTGQSNLKEFSGGLAFEVEDESSVHDVCGRMLEGPWYRVSSSLFVYNL